MDVLTTASLNEADLLRLFQKADKMRAIDQHGAGSDNFLTRLAGRVVATLFFEPSTRTRFSFEAAAQRLGVGVISAADGTSLSLAKGESVADTIEAVSEYAEAIVMRHNEPHEEWFRPGAKRVPVVNAGDGCHNHPTQAFLDVYTIWREHAARGFRPRGAVPNNVKTVVMGDALKSRTIRSFVELMGRNVSNTFTVYSPGDHGRIQEMVRSDIEYVAFSDDLKEALKTADVVYLNRIQTERRGRETETSRSGGPPSVRALPFSRELMDLTRPDCIILNPGPRRHELPDETVDDPRVKMRDQVKNGLYLRMALLHKLLDNTPADLL